MSEVPAQTSGGQIGFSVVDQDGNPVPVASIADDASTVAGGDMVITVQVPMTPADVQAIRDAFSDMQAAVQAADAAVAALAATIPPAAA